ncbi:cytochrome P450 [Kutzneria sp. CA-103260]|uniref:cytochrome P450 n=1 Tax=Kutzneria sp. CA-103260 TaxID=2802641 RepID=UPI001BACD08A|nr:cytochrome P450 [Kutzneria sp. CA-103260]QUQ72343.1 cytochrome P450 [Kutzneria sp. CA-103260]
MDEPMYGLPTERANPFDPPEVYRELRDRCPVSRMRMPVSLDGQDGWLVTGLDEARAVLADNRFSHRKELVSLAIPSPIPLGDHKYEPTPAAPGAFIAMDPPEHGRYRRMLTGHFTVRRVRELEPLMERVAGRYLDEMAAAGGPVDLVSAFAHPFPIDMMCELVGVPEWARQPAVDHLAMVARTSYTMEEIMAAITELPVILTRLIEDAKAAPAGDDMLSALVRLPDVTDEELVSLLWTVLGGGFDTSGNMLALGTFALLEHPDQLARLRAEPELLDNAIEELLRYLTISQFGASRAALEDVEIGGQLIEKGQTVAVGLPAANRDPNKFPDPDRLDICRSTQGHLAFGHGVHQCLGQNLARMTLRVGYRMLFDRFPTLRLATPASEVPTGGDLVHYGVHKLMVTWDEPDHA